MNLRSLQFRIPLSLVSGAIIATLAVSFVITFETYINLKEEQAGQIRLLAHALTPTLTQALKHDDVWGAYRVLHGPRGRAAVETLDDSYMLLLDADRRIFTSNRPRRFRVNQALDQHPPELASLVGQASRAGTLTMTTIGNRQVAALPLMEDDVERGMLVISSRGGAFWGRFLDIMAGGLIAVIVVSVILLPLGWQLGRRLIAPLTSLAHCMERIGKESIDTINCPVYKGEDEVSQLGMRFHRMLTELKNKKLLERQLVAQERLAAIGRLSSGVAHEINNPLAGMLVAIDTYRQSPPDRRDAEKTLGFMERGLQHIRDTVAALLVECRIEPRSLTSADIDDLETLIRSNELAKRARLDWRSDLQGDTDLPAAPVRQVLLNLALNALQAIGPGGSVTISVARRKGQLDIRVGDDGPQIPQETLDHIFEPFHSERPGGTGLGLWVTYETVRQLGGQIIVDSQPEWTWFQVQLPVSGNNLSNPEAAA